MLALLLCLGGVVSPVVWAGWENVPELQHPVVLAEGAIELDHLEAWSRQVEVPDVGADKVPVLRLRARLDTQGDGGCNFVLRVAIDDRTLEEDPFRPRLLNKPLDFDPPGTDYHFQWYRDGLWMVIFTRTFETDWGGSGHDAEFLLDLSGLVGPGQTAEVSFSNRASIDIAGALGVDRAPLVVVDPVIGLLDDADVERLRDEALGGAAPRSAAVEPDLPSDAVAGDRAYEVVWSGRPEPPSQVTFDDLDGWRVRVRGDASVALSASVEHLLWRPQVAKFTYGGGTRRTMAEIRPPEPVTIEEPFDAVNLWLYGDLHRQPTWDKPIRLWARLEDSEGAEHHVDLGPVRSGYWGLQHGVLGAETELRWPIRFTGLLISDCRVEGEREIYFESMHFYRQERRPRESYGRPDAPVFPMSDDGILPTPPADVKLSARAEGAGAVFVSESPTGTLTVTVDPERGCLSGIVAQWADGAWFRPVAGGGVRLGAGAKIAADAELIESTLEAGTLVSRCRSDSAEAEWMALYRLRGRTLVVDVRCTRGRADGLDFGAITGLEEPKAIRVPYLYLNGPVSVACGEGVFISVLPDFYYSDFSAPLPTTEAADGEGLRIFGGTRYDPLSDGTRNPLWERVLITVSPEFADVLPNAPNPVSPNRERLAPYMFVMSSSACPNLWRTMKRYGIDHVIANDFAGFFVNDYAEGFAMRWRPHPLLTIEQMQAYVREVKDLGYLFGAYADFTDFFPLNEFWDESKVCLTPDGDLADAWYGNFATKPSEMWRLVREVGGKCRELYEPDCVYLDVHTNRGPTALDYEAGAAGAGIGRSVLIGNGDAIVQARQHYGSTMSEGYHRWLYAGLCDMDYATLGGWSDPSGSAPLVDFDLLKIHPHEHGMMMGYSPSRFLSDEELKSLNDPGCIGPDSFYRYVCASLAYGHMLLLGYSYIPPLHRTIHYYALMQGVQKEYLTDNAVKISYHDGTEYVGTSRALIDGSQGKGRVRVEYSRGMTVHVNYNESESWSVDLNGRTFELGPFGWVIAKSGEILAYSAMVNGHWQDFVRCPDYLYLNTGEVGGEEGPVRVTGAVWVKRQKDGWRVIPCGNLGSWERFTPEGFPQRHKDYRLAGPPAGRGCTGLSIDTEALIGKAAEDVEVMGRNERGEQIVADATAKGRRLSIKTGRDVVDYVLR